MLHTYSTRERLSRELGRDEEGHHGDVGSNSRSNYVSYHRITITLTISDLVSSPSTEDCPERQRPWSEIRTSGTAVDIVYLTLSVDR